MHAKLHKKIIVSKFFVLKKEGIIQKWHFCITKVAFPCHRSTTLTTQKCHFHQVKVALLLYYFKMSFSVQFYCIPRNMLTTWLASSMVIIPSPLTSAASKTNPFGAMPRK